jgi:hypothetical protein
MASRFWNLVKKAKELYGWYRFVVAVALLLASGVGVAVAGTVWLVSAGVPLPLAIMAGYCTLIAAVWAALAPFAFRAFAHGQTVNVQGPTTASIKAAPPLNLTAIRLQHQYRLGEASRLWINLPPNVKYSNTESAAWCDTLISAIQQGQLGFRPSGDERALIAYERQHPETTTIITREELKRYAASIGQDPAFLRDS